jgi:hypothetical protein
MVGFKMFLDELLPIAREVMKNPIAFAGGFASGILRLDLNEDPVKSWLGKQSNSKSGLDKPKAPPSGPQSIDID